MQKILLLTAILLISSCSMFVAGHLSDSNKDLYNLQDNREYCRIDPEKCQNDVQKP